MTVKDCTTIDSLEQLIEARAELHEPSAELAEREDRYEQVINQVADLVSRQQDLRRRLADARTDAERAKARAALATQVAEAAILPDEATMAGEAFALAVHRWASACFAELERLRTQERGETTAALDAAEGEDQEAKAKAHDTTKPRFTTAGVHARWDKRERALLKIGKRITDSCRPVFPYRPVRSVTEFGALKGQVGTITDEGKLTGHERWLERQRARVEEQLRA